jgi:hypothetical protein
MRLDRIALLALGFALAACGGGGDGGGGTTNGAVTGDIGFAYVANLDAAPTAASR